MNLTISMLIKLTLSIVFVFITRATGDISSEIQAGHQAQPIHFTFQPVTTDFWKPKKTGTVQSDTNALKQSSWYAEAMHGIEDMEYEIKYDENIKHYASPNRKNNLRSFYTANTFTLLPRNDSADKWELELTTLGVYVKNQLLYTPSKSAIVSLDQKAIRFNQGDNFITEYVNSKEGVRQNFIITKAPGIKNEELRMKNEPGTRNQKLQTLNLKLQTNKGWYVNKVHDKEIHFAKATKTGYDKKITYNGLKVWDANNKELAASFSVKEDIVSIDVTTTGAVYPITIDPISTTANWMVESNVSNMQLGRTVASAGDVNGDGYSDVLIAAPTFNGGQAFEGKVFLYYGSATGLSLTAGWTVEGNQVGARLGQNCGTAGDVNGDGYGDIIIGIPFFDNGESDEGMVYVFYGSASGPAASPNWTMESNQTTASMGTSVACAGDVNGDGYSDVIIGAPNYSNDQVSEGRAYIFHGSATGLSLTANWTAESNQSFCYFAGGDTNYGGNSVASAGDVNGDGYSDVLVSAINYDNGNFNEGKVFLYLGSAFGVSLTSSWSYEGNQDNTLLGNSIISAGDVNGDGYSDVAVAAPFFDNGQTDEGIVYLFNGSASGLSVAANQSFELNLANVHFGSGLSCAGDVNGDGYADLIVGAPEYGSPELQEGTAVIYFGSASGLSAIPGWQVETNQSGFAFGHTVAAAGDVNGDGYSDVIVGAPQYYNVESMEGAAFVYHGSAGGVIATYTDMLQGDQISASMGISVSSAGDVNGDGYSDVIVGAYLYDHGETDEGAAFIYHGSSTGLGSSFAVRLESNQASAQFGFCVANAGDVNGDGYSDVVVGAPVYDIIQTDEGAAFVYYGSPAGVNPVAAAILQRNQATAYMGNAVASAGDVNGDGYSDIVVGAPYYDDGENNEGAAFIYHGSLAGINTIAAAMVESNQINAYMGNAVAAAGDVNGDGFGDLLVAAYFYVTGAVNDGSVFIYHGSSSGINTVAAAFVESFQANSQNGVSVAAAGDVNGDGYGDIIVGAQYYNNGTPLEGAAFVYMGSATGIVTTPAATLNSGNFLSRFGGSVSAAGDINGDGYNDVIVGASQYDNALADQGAVFVYLGSPSGINPVAALVIESNQANAYLGRSVGYAGDINGDGYSDIIAGAYGYDNGQTDEGAAFVYYGNTSVSNIRNNVRLYNSDLTTPISSTNFLLADFGTGLYAKSFLGRQKGKMVWETRLNFNAYSGNPITNSTASTAQQGSYTDMGLSGTEFKSLVDKILSGGNYTKVRARVKYNPVTAITGQVYGPWRQSASVIDGNRLGALPIELISFGAAWIQTGKSARIRFETDKENGICCFDVEKSYDGIMYDAIGSVPAKNTPGKQSYSFVDNNARQSRQFYRLKIKGNDGRFEYSHIARLEHDGMATVLLFPNPVEDAIHLQFTNAPGVVQASIFNMAGQLYKEIAQLKIPTGGVVTIPVADLPKGKYLIRLSNDKMNTVLSFIK